MSDFFVFVLSLAIPLTAICGGILLAALSIYRKGRLRELAYRERIAMIERGLVPPPEVDPERFDRVMRGVPDEAHARSRGAAARRRSAGVMLIGAGLALMMIIYFAGNEPGSALGVGGSMVVIGLALVVNALLDQRHLNTLPVAPTADAPQTSTTSGTERR